MQWPHGCALFARIIISLVLLVSGTSSGFASKCIGYAEGRAGVQLASLKAPASDDKSVRITFVDHATFRIESPEGVVVVTDYAGNAGGSAPDVATMNKAHDTHFTATPDPAIQHVLKGLVRGRRRKTPPPRCR